MRPGLDLIKLLGALLSKVDGVRLLDKRLKVLKDWPRNKEAPCGPQTKIIALVLCKKMFERGIFF